MLRQQICQKRRKAIKIIPILPVCMTQMDIDYELMLLFSKMNASKRFVILYTMKNIFQTNIFLI